MRTPRHVLAACALLASLACGACAAAVEGGETNAALGVNPVARGAVAPVKATVTFGGDYRFDNGVVVSVSTPKSFRPSATAYPQSERAAAFEIVVRNDGAQPYRLSGFSVVATVAGTQAKQVVDATQGFSGIVEAGKDVPPARNVRMNLAFAVTPEPADLELTIRPEATSPVVVTYSGPA
ncbi:hypothetical protein [Amycolatopsis nigrescens]|uniref:hypothetical protein n=1 Tax=Amycolatopsis nigrescens TaxID=381445 RepID=UPI000361F307|nr:hypothetical protein [Amycolatopsis nigrescens]